MFSSRLQQINNLKIRFGQVCHKTAIRKELLNIMRYYYSLAISCGRGVTRDTHLCHFLRMKLILLAQIQCNGNRCLS